VVVVAVTAEVDRREVSSGKRVGEVVADFRDHGPGLLVCTLVRLSEGESGASRVLQGATESMLGVWTGSGAEAPFFFSRPIRPEAEASRHRVCGATGGRANAGADALTSLRLLDGDAGYTWRMRKFCW
jgi:hypothetical protein